MTARVAYFVAYEYGTFYASITGLLNSYDLFK